MICQYVGAGIKGCRHGIIRGVGVLVIQFVAGDPALKIVVIGDRQRVPRGGEAVVHNGRIQRKAGHCQHFVGGGAGEHVARLRLADRIYGAESVLVVHPVFQIEQHAVVKIGAMYGVAENGFPYFHARAAAAGASEGSTVNGALVGHVLPRRHVERPAGNGQHRGTLRRARVKVERHHLVARRYIIA